MITVNKIISPDGETIGVEMLVNDETYFVTKDQEKWPGIRMNNHPRYTDDKGNLIDVRREVLIYIQ